ncbi:MAG: DUF551 domain-containing protein [Solobacterium sp.]|jgi:hypothetical protein|nr:DUF551 domain-containing protein [Solobacterium sp.]MCH4205301.1 DUF551 domain-containing protein [Solobacterium sp.]MCH4226894.1 DUF551 domain-containing protein [Solobacterium sp.]MCH4281654.1 DUF551 domain-containing protein [Solobacterium sp.]
MKSEWISVNAAKPKPETRVLACTDGGNVITAMYEDGNVSENKTIFGWEGIDWIEKEDGLYIPESWYEYSEFIDYDDNIFPVYEKVVAWMPLPERYEQNE